MRLLLYTTLTLFTFIATTYTARCQTDNPALIEDCLPEYPGGEKAMLNFLNNNINPGITCKGLCSFTRRVIVRFDIDSCGRVGNVRLLKGEAALGNEAIRIVKLLPDFIPCYNQWGKITYTLPMQFCL